MNIPHIGWSVVLVVGALVCCGCGSSKKQQATSAFDQGFACYQKGEFDKAIADFTEAIRLNPQFAGAYYYRGLLYTHHKGDYDKAIADCTEAIQHDPTLAEAYDCRATAYYLGSQYDKAWADVEAFQRLRGEVDPEFLADLRKVSGREE